MIEFLTLAAVVYLSVTGFVFAFQRSLLYYPDRSMPSRQASGVSDMTETSLLTSDGLSLLAWYRPAAIGKPTLVLFHGNAGHIGHRGIKVRPYLDAGLGVLLVEYRGYGGNDGAPSEEGLYQDGRAALEFLDGEGVSGTRVVLYGESLGAGICVQMARERPVGALVLEAALTSVGDVAAHHYPYLPARWLALDRFDNVAKIPFVSVPVLMIHGERDRIVPVRFGRALFEAAVEPKEISIFPEANHNDLHQFPLSDLVIGFLSRHMTGAG
jgi:hypothetical protein